MYLVNCHCNFPAIDLTFFVEAINEAIEEFKAYRERLAAEKTEEGTVENVLTDEFALVSNYLGIDSEASEAEEAIEKILNDPEELDRVQTACLGALGRVCGRVLQKALDVLAKRVARKAAEKVSKQVDEIIARTNPGRRTKGKTSQRETTGGFKKANEDFDSLKPDNIRTFTTKDGKIGRVGELKDGRTITSRPTSSDGRPTLEIRNPVTGRGIEIRYD